MAALHIQPTNELTDVDGYLTGSELSGPRQKFVRGHGAWRLIILAHGLVEFNANSR